MLSLHHLELMDIRITIVEEERNGRGILVLNCLDLEVTHFISTHSPLDRPNKRALIEKKEKLGRKRAVGIFGDHSVFHRRI